MLVISFLVKIQMVFSFIEAYMQDVFLVIIKKMMKVLEYIKTEQ